MADILRTRLIEALRNAATRPVSVISAPAGFGKSTLLTQFCREHSSAALRFRVRRSHATLLGFLRGLSDAIAPVVPDAYRSFAGAYEQASTSKTSCEDLALWFLEHVREGGFTIVVDDVHNIWHDPAAIEFLTLAVEHTADRLTWILAGRTMDHLPLPLWMATNKSRIPLGPRELALTIDEARAMAGSIDERRFGHLFAVTHAVPGAFAAALALPETFAELAPQNDVYAATIAHVLQALSAHERDLLVMGALLPRLDDDLIAATLGPASMVAFAALVGKLDFAFDTRPPLRYRESFRSVVLERYGPRSGRSSAALRRLASGLSACGNVDEAVTLYIEAGSPRDAIELVHAHGFTLIDGGNADLVERVIRAVEGTEHSNHPVTMTLHALLESRRGRFDTAESHYTAALAQAGERGLREAIAYRYGLELLRRQRKGVPLLLESYVGDSQTSAPMRPVMRGLLASAYSFEGEREKAQVLIDAALERIDDVPVVNRARLLHQAAYVAILSRQYERAAGYARQAIDMALPAGQFDVAARAYTALYNIAYEVEDDHVRALEYLEEFARYASKAGDSQMRVLALLGSFDIEVELANHEAIARIERALAQSELAQYASAVDEALLPSQAMRAAWGAQFDYAYRLLAPTTGSQPTPQRRALRFAETALYAAGAGMTAQAKAAIDAGIAQLPPAADWIACTLRAAIYLALAATLINDEDCARAMVSAAESASARGSRRLIAALRVVKALRTVRALDKKNVRRAGFRHLIASLDMLPKEGFGGFAALITALPNAEVFSYGR